MELSQLLRQSNRYLTRGEPSLPRLSVYQRLAVSQIEALIYDPVVCLVLQGSKVTSIGVQQVTLRPGDALVVSHHLPVISRIVSCSPREPYVALILSLDIPLIRSLYAELSEAPFDGRNFNPLTVGTADLSWVEPLTRYLNLADNSMDARVLGPSALREIHYRLLLSPIGQTLRQLLVTESPASRVGKAIQVIREDFRVPLAASTLAEAAGMSPSSFHAHFKSVTGTTPLQYQKDLRLIEAHSLLTEQDRSVSDAAYSVGYESPTHFSRDYSRKFGIPPGRAAQQNRQAVRA